MRLLFVTSSVSPSVSLPLLLLIDTSFCLSTSVSYTLSLILFLSLRFFTIMCFSSVSFPMSSPLPLTLCLFHSHSSSLCVSRAVPSFCLHSSLLVFPRLSYILLKFLLGSVSPSLSLPLSPSAFCLPLLSPVSTLCFALTISSTLLSPFVSP